MIRSIGEKQKVESKKQTFLLSAFCFLLFLTSTQLWNPPSGISAEHDASKPSYTTNAADRAACERQLNVIYGAIQEYQRQNQKLPRWLSDLVPDFIHDPNMLVCPFVIKSGNLKQWRAAYVNFPVFGDPGSCSYAYEFCAELFRYVPGWTQRTYKQRQMRLMGFGVPIVRCFVHRPILNLGFDGSIYASGGEWEDNFVISPKYRRPFHSFNTNSSQNEIVRHLIEPRKPKSDARMLDLSNDYNALLLHLSRLDSSGKLLVTYPEGRQRIAGIDFDIRGLVHLTGRDFAVDFPDRVEDIHIDRKCAQIHFLHGTMFSAPKDTRIAAYVVHYGDGPTNDVPIVYGQDVKTRWFDPEREPQLQNPKAAWVSPPDQIGATGKSLRLYVTTWKNPRPNSEVKSIDFISQMTQSAPFLVAITVE